MRIITIWPCLLTFFLQLIQLDIIRASSKEVWESPVTPFLSRTLKTSLLSKINLENMRNLQNNSNPVSLTEANFTDLLNNMEFFGNWFSGNHANQLNYLTEDSGFAMVEEADTDNSDTSMMNIDIALYNGKYVDEDYLVIRAELPISNFEFNQTNATIVGTNLPLMVSNDGFDKNSQNCTSNISIFFIDLENGLPFTNPVNKGNNFGVQFIVNSSDCALSIYTNSMTNSEVTTEQLAVYICLMSFTALMGLYSSNKLRIGFPLQMEKLKKFSIWSVWLINAWDFYLFLLHVALAVEVSAWLMIIALLFFGLSIIYQTRLVYAIYFSTQYGANDSVVTGCKFFAAYYCLLYLLDFSYTYYARVDWLLITSSFYLVPQIIHVYKRAIKYKFNFWHIFGFLMSRVFFIVYLKLYPDNIYRSSPDPAFVFTYIGIVLVQIFILLAQRRWPKFWYTPKPFNYYVKLQTEEERQEICAICMEPLGETPHDPAKPFLNKTKTTLVMQTPCNHRYHTSCLQEWMKAKLVCPNDRLDIPSLNNEEMN